MIETGMCMRENTEASSLIIIGLFPRFSKSSKACLACCSQVSIPSSWCTLIAAAQNSSKSNFLYWIELICNNDRVTKSLSKEKNFEKNLIQVILPQRLTMFT